MFKYLAIISSLVLVNCASSSVQIQRQLLEKTRRDSLEQFVKDASDEIITKIPQAEVLTKVEDVKFMDNYNLALIQVRMRVTLKTLRASREEFIFMFMVRKSAGGWVPFGTVRRPVDFSIDKPEETWEKAPTQ